MIQFAQGLGVIGWNMLATSNLRYIKKVCNRNRVFSSKLGFSECSAWRNPDESGLTLSFYMSLSNSPMHLDYVHIINLTQIQLAGLVK